MYQANGNTMLARFLCWSALVLDGILLFLIVVCLMQGSSGVIALLTLTGVSATIAAAAFAYRQGLLFEIRVERRWREICAGLHFQREVRSLRHGLIGAYRDGETKTEYPKIRHVHGDADEGWTAIITPLPSQTIDQYNKNSASFVLAFDCPFVSFEAAGGNRILMRCGYLPVPAAYEYDALPAMLPEGELTGLPPVPMAVKIDGSPYWLYIEGNHLLIAGRTGAGKSSWIWSLVFGVMDMRQAGVVRLWGIDPKRVELAYGREFWDEYADTPEAIVELLERAVADLLKRNAMLQGYARKITPSEKMPLNVIVIDELAYLSVLMPDKKLKDRAQAAMSTILILGRATGYALVGASQDPRKSVLDFRDLFPTRVALGMEAPMINLVLGDGMREAGAYADQIPARDAGAGCAYVLEETSSKPVLVRAAWVSDEAIRTALDLTADAREDLTWPPGTN